MPRAKRASGRSRLRPPHHRLLRSVPAVIREQRKAGADIAAPIEEEMTLKRFITSAAVATVITAGLGGQAMAQGTPQTVAIMKVDPQTVATGFRSSKIVGSSVVNRNSWIG
jgi:hypothetical protein